MLKTFWERLIHVLKTNVSLTIIVVAAILLELTTAVQYYYAQQIIHRVVERYIRSEMNANSLYIQNQLTKAEADVNNTVWLDEIINANKQYASTQRILLAHDGAVLAGNKEQAANLHIGQLVHDDPDHDGYLSVTDDTGEKLHVYYDAVDGTTGWTMTYICHDSDIFGKLRRVRTILVVLILAGLLLVSFIVWRISRHLERLRQVNAAKDRIDNELRIATNIQKEMLPEQSLKTKREDVDIFGSLVPAREVGGDLFDYFIRDEKLFFCIGDVSGKGVPSAMVMAVIHSLFRMASAHENNPACMMQTINETSCEGNESNMFVTMFIGVLDLPTGHLCFCNAGHDAPVIVGREALPVKANIPLGLFDDYTYQMQETMLEGGSMLFLYTDGLTEAKNRQREQFGLSRVKTVLQGSADLSPEQLLEKMTGEVHAFVEDAEQSDDLTMLAIRYTPICHDLVLDEQLTLLNDVHQIPQLNAFVKQIMERLGIESSLAKKLQLAVEEAVVNVMEYAYPVGGGGDINLQVSSDGQSLKFVIKDHGVAFDPTMKETPDTTLSVEDRPIGGLGILLVRELMDSINYERTGGMNVLTLIKKIKH